MDEWKIMSTWHYNDNYKYVELELQNSCSCIVATKLHELHNSTYDELCLLQLM
jgi:hypothetical protein